MPLLTDDVVAQLKGEFAKLQNPVRLAVFSQALADPHSEQVKRLCEELVALDPKLSVESYNFVLDKEKADSLGILRIPAIAVLGQEKDYGIRLYGLPSGYEFGMLIDAILDVSAGTSVVSAETKAVLDGLEKSVHIQVFSTPTCPYCPRAARLAFQFALASDKVTADSVEVTGFPELAQKYRISGVPKTVVGETLDLGFVGAQPESVLLDHVQQAAQAKSSLIV